MKKLFIFTFILAFCSAAAMASVVQVHFIAVGHGDAILIELDGKALALVDAGQAKAGDSLLAYLRGRGITRIPHLFATHTHPDHVGSMCMILDSLRVGTVHVTGMVDTWGPAADLTEHLQTGRWAIDTTDVGEVPIRKGDFKIEVLSPPADETAGKTGDLNANSMVLLLTHGKVRILLAADIDQNRQEWLVKRFGSRLESAALKVPHHGSGGGYSEAFVQTVKPTFAVISVGPNGWGYPSTETIRKLNEEVAVVLRTDEVGTIILQSDGSKAAVISPYEIRP